MYPNYNMVQNYPNMYQNNQYFYRTQNKNNQGDRIVPAGFIAPLLLGGIAGYAIGRPNNYPYPYPYNYYYNNIYYPPYYNFY